MQPRLRYTGAAGASSRKIEISPSACPRAFPTSKWRWATNWWQHAHLSMWPTAPRAESVFSENTHSMGIRCSSGRIQGGAGLSVFRGELAQGEGKLAARGVWVLRRYRYVKRLRRYAKRLSYCSHAYTIRALPAHLRAKFMSVSHAPTPTVPTSWVSRNGRNRFGLYFPLYARCNEGGRRNAVGWCSLVGLFVRPSRLRRLRRRRRPWDTTRGESPAHPLKFAVSCRKWENRPILIGERT